MEKVTVSPTLSEAFHYANLSGQILWTVIGVVLLLGAAVLLYLAAKDYYETTKGTVIGIGVIIAFGLVSILAKPIAINISNDKLVTKDYLEQVGKKYILDSCYNNNLMINAAKKK